MELMNTLSNGENSDMPSLKLRESHSGKLVV
jgi:hypothetical protein